MVTRAGAPRRSLRRLIANVTSVTPKAERKCDAFRDHQPKRQARLATDGVSLAATQGGFKYDRVALAEFILAALGVRRDPQGAPIHVDARRSRGQPSQPRSL